MLVVGLGNPGPDYEKTRHNIGFMVIDELLTRLQATNVTSSSFLGECYKYQNHFLLKPLTFMNLSGESVLKVKNFYKLEQVVVIHDDLDLPFGSLRFKHGGGHGGHNGLKSIDSKIGREYIRVRMGIGKPKHKGAVVSHVLSPFSQQEQSCLPQWIDKTADAVMSLFDTSLEDVRAKFSQKSIEC